MRLADDARKCVVYVGTQKNSDSEIDPWGTGFLVSTGEEGGVYIVTARHVVHERDDCPVSVRLNTKEGEGKNIHFDAPKWAFHPDDAVDVAVLRFDPPAWADFTVYPRKSFLNEARVATKGLGAGDLVYVVGVFSHFQGAHKNIPFVHTGHIAVWLEGEKVNGHDWRVKSVTQPLPMDGILAQVTVLPGASGSPVFVRRSIKTRIIDPNPPKCPSTKFASRANRLWFATDGGFRWEWPRHVDDREPAPL